MPVVPKSGDDDMPFGYFVKKTKMTHGGNPSVSKICCSKNKRGFCNEFGNSTQTGLRYWDLGSTLFSVSSVWVTLGFR